MILFYYFSSEHIDDDCDEKGIVFVKTDDKEAAEKYGIKKLPVVLFFKFQVPSQYNGDIMNEEQVLKWFIDQQETDEIEDVNSRTLKSLIDTSDSLAVLFYDSDSPKSALVLKDLEEIDDDADKYDIPFVKIDDDVIAKEYGLDDELPILVYFENRLPSVYEGDLTKEEQVLEWLIKQKTEDTVEEVTEEILEDLIREREYVLVFFAPNNCKECDDILHKCLETIDDDTDEHGILLVTTDDLNIAKKQAKVNKFPALVLFRNGEAVQYKGDMKKPESILKWVTSEEALDKPDEIEEVNHKMLDKMLDKSPYIAVLFTKEKCSECDKVLTELENIDHIAEENDIDFVKVKDPKLAKEYNIVTFPTLIFFRKRFPQFYEGNLKDEETVLQWLIDNKVAKEDVIELVDRYMLEVLLDDIDHIVVFFYDGDDCKTCEKILNELENIDDDTDKHGIHFVSILLLLHSIFFSSSLKYLFILFTTLSFSYTLNHKIINK
jgi:thiol-disulfide isomerase/thioredoxin